MVLCPFLRGRLMLVQTRNVTVSKCFWRLINESIRFPTCLKLNIRNRLPKNLLASFNCFITSMLFDLLTHHICVISYYKSITFKEIKSINGQNGIQLNQVQPILRLQYLIFPYGSLQIINLNMKINKNGENKLKNGINLFDYARGRCQMKQNSSKLQEKGQKAISHQLQNSNLRQQSQDYGFDTLLYFNDSLNISSIRPLQTPSFSKKSRINRYELLISQAREDIQRLKQRRVQYQAQWKPISPHYAKQEVDQSLVQSQVTLYNLDSTVFPTRPEDKTEDKFIIELKQSIKKDKIDKFIFKIKKVAFAQFVKELYTFNQILNFKKKERDRIIGLVFNEWKQMIEQMQSRRRIRLAILNRIKVKRNQKNEEQYLSQIINN